MKFMVIRKADAETEAGVMPTDELVAAMSAYNEALIKDGRFLGGAGLKPSAQGARVVFSGGEPTIVDGPFAEAKELIAGYSIIEAASKAEVIEIVKGWPCLDGHGAVEIEIRPLYEIGDFGSSEAIDRLREVMAEVGV